DRDLLANIRSNLFYFDLFACSNLVLFATGFYDRVHISPFSKSTGPLCKRVANEALTGSAAISAEPLSVPRGHPPNGLAARSTHPKAAGSVRRNRTRPVLSIIWQLFRQPSVQQLSSLPLAARSLSELMAADMLQVDSVIQRRLASDVAMINQIAHYIISAGGKRIRPMLVLLFSKALGFQGPERHELAATVEFIHTATLLHDDVVDESALRRGRQTANALFGNAASVLVGDFVYSRAFQMMVSVNRMRVLDVLADATNVIAEGEVLQLMNMHDPDLAVEDYLRVIRFKTAKLFEASARLGAVLAQVDSDVEESCADYGRSLGTAFQLVDDLLDYEGSTSQLGKNVGDDLREGKPTLPLLLAMERGTSVERDLIRHAIQHGEIARLSEIVEIVRHTGAITATRDAARAEAAVAKRSLDMLPQSEHRDALLELCVRSVERSS
ncbi:MAG: hypothetical protein RL701_7872, partial [Pseudomonadota bacterium]